MEDLLKALTLQLGTITRANNYTTDAGLKILYWQEIPLDYDGPAAIAIFDQPGDNAQTISQVGQKHEYTLPIEIQALSFEVDGLTPLELSCRLIDDIIRCVAGNLTLDGLCFNPVLRSTSKNIEVAGKRAVQVTVSFDYKYRRNLYQVTLDPARQ